MFNTFAEEVFFLDLALNLKNIRKIGYLFKMSL